MTATPTGRPRALGIALVLFLLIGLLGSHADSSSARGGRDDRLQAKIRACANGIRARHGLKPLRNSKPLNQAASLHAHDMARRGYFGHTDPQGRGPKDRVEQFPGGGRFGVVGENIAAGYGGRNAACKAWRKSPTHRAAMLDPKYRFVGGGFSRGGRYGTYFVQEFARR